MSIAAVRNKETGYVFYDFFSHPVQIKRLKDGQTEVTVPFDPDVISRAFAQSGTLTFFPDKYGVLTWISQDGMFNTLQEPIELTGNVVFRKMNHSSSA